MQWTEILFGALASIGLFVHSLEHFSAKIEKRADASLKSLIKRISDNKYKGLFLGFAATAIIQSSSAVISIVVSFVDSGVISFGSSLPILLGANIGTTVTAWLVSFDIAYLGMILLSIGFITSYFPEKIKFYSKPVFYLGLILFSLELIGFALEPLKNSPETIEFLKYAANPFIGILLGMILTALTQSSSVAIGLAIILADQGVLDLNSAIGILVGSNLGTTSTAFIASMKMGKIAKRTALLNLAINSFGVIVYLPFYSLYADMIDSINAPIAMQVAYAHLIFNVGIALLLMPFMKNIVKWIEEYFRKKDLKADAV
jgi:phosphate:Na+ symporter